MDNEVNNLRPMTIGVANQVELKIEDKALLGMAVCIQLASKNVGRISAVSAMSLYFFLYDKLEFFVILNVF